MKQHLALAIVVGLAAFGGATSAAEDPFHFLYTDMSFTMFCDYPRGREQDPTFDQKIESFLRKEDFKVVNYGRPRIGQLDYSLRVVGLDVRRQVVEFNGTRGNPGRYGVLLWIEPLRPRAIELEEKLQRFAADDLKCDVRFVKQEKNDHRSLKLFNHKVDEIEDSLRQLERRDLNQRN